MDTFSTAVFIILVVGGLAWMKIQKAANNASPEVREKAKEIGWACSANG